MTIALLLVAVAVQAPARDVKPAGFGGATISGLVTSDEAQPRPLRRARVTLSGEALVAGQTVVTSDDGTFVFAGVPAGNYELAAAKDAYVTMNYGAARAGLPGRTFAVVAGDQRHIDLRLPRGAVITGAVLDAEGQPVQGVAVLALARRMTGPVPQYRDSGSPALPTDDRGTYRIFGLPAGEYIIEVQPSGRTAGFAGGDAVRKMSGAAASDRTFALAQVFYPSVTDVTRAERVSVGAGEERSGIDVQLQLVPLASMTGFVPVQTGWTPAQVSLALLDEASTAVRARQTRSDAEGRFAFTGLPPGRYRVTARTAREDAPRQIEMIGEGEMRIGAAVQLTGSIDVTVAGDDLNSVAVPLQPPLSMTGRLAFEGERPPFPLTDLQIAVPAGPATTEQRFPALRVDGTTFRADGIEPGAYRFEAHQIGGGRTGAWWLKSFVVDGVDVLDAPFDIRQSVDGAVATISDRASTLSGTVRDAAGNVFGNVTVVAFAADRRTWFFRSRRVAAVRTDAAGRYAIRNLPPGEYRVVETTALEENEWFDPAVLERLLPEAASASVTDGGSTTLDLTIR